MNTSQHPKICKAIHCTASKEKVNDKIKKHLQMHAHTWRRTSTHAHAPRHVCTCILMGESNGSDLAGFKILFNLDLSRVD